MPQGLRGRPDSLNFGMGRRVAGLAVGPPAQHDPTADDDRPHRDIPSQEGASGLLKGGLHESLFDSLSESSFKKSPFRSLLFRSLFFRSLFEGGRISVPQILTFRTNFLMLPGSLKHTQGLWASSGENRTNWPGGT